MFGALSLYRPRDEWTRIIRRIEVPVFPSSPGANLDFATPIEGSDDCVWKLGLQKGRAACGCVGQFWMLFLTLMTLPTTGVETLMRITAVFKGCEDKRKVGENNFRDVRRFEINELIDNETLIETRRNSSVYLELTIEYKANGCCKRQKTEETEKSILACLDDVVYLVTSNGEDVCSVRKSYAASKAKGLYKLIEKVEPGQNYDVHISRRILLPIVKYIMDDVFMPELLRYNDADAANVLKYCSEKYYKVKDLYYFICENHNGYLLKMTPIL